MNGNLESYDIYFISIKNLIKRVENISSWQYNKFLDTKWKLERKKVLDILYSEYPTLLLAVFERNLQTLELELAKLEAKFLDNDYDDIVIQAGVITQDILSYIYFYTHKEQKIGDASIYDYQFDTKVKNFIEDKFSEQTMGDIDYIRRNRNPRAHSVMHTVTASEARQSLSRTKLLLDSLRVWLTNQTK